MFEEMESAPEFPVLTGWTVGVEPDGDIVTAITPLFMLREGEIHAGSSTMFGSRPALPSDH